MDRKLLILFGSQTGTAQDVAEKLTKEAKRRHFSVKVMAMDSYSIVSIVTSTPSMENSNLLAELLFVTLTIHLLQWAKWQGSCQTKANMFSCCLTL